MKVSDAIVQVAPTIIISTLTLIIGFSPLYLLGGDTGQFIRALPQVMIVTLLTSTCAALILVPAIRCILASKRPSLHKTWNEQGWIKLKRWYESRLKWVIAHYRISSTFLLLTSSLLICFALLLEVQFFPKAEERKELLIDI